MKNLFVMALVLGLAVATQAQIYTYDGASDTAGAGAFDSLDGTWDHANGSDEWDGTGMGAGNPGGAMSLTDGLDRFLRIQDTGDPRDYGMGDPGSNRKIMFGHDLTGAVSPTYLDDGITLEFRARIPSTAPLDDAHPDGGGGISPWPAGGEGYRIHDGGKGSISLRQADGDKIISFSLVKEDDIEPQGAFSASGLTMNNLNGNAPSGDVDTGEGGTQNILAVDPTVWHTYRVDIKAGGAGTHILDISVDGAPVVSYDVTAGNGNDYDLDYLAMGQGATPGLGAIDIDYVSVIPEPMTVVLLGLGAVGALRRRR
jgi:hypothetical protein